MPFPKILWRNLLPETVTGHHRLLSACRHRFQPPLLLKEGHSWKHTGSSRRFYASLMNAPEKFGNFDLVRRFKLDFTDVTVSKWRSRTTGFSVVHLDYEGQPTCRRIVVQAKLNSSSAPIVNGYCVVATESTHP
jgi:hypothetical protein